MFTDISTEKPQFSMFRSFFINLADLTAAQRSRFVCAAGDCHVPEHWSLATCQECEDSNFYNDAAMNCTYHYGNLIDGGHSLKKFKAQAKRYNGANYSDHGHLVQYHAVLQGQIFLTFLFVVRNFLVSQARDTRLIFSGVSNYLMVESRNIVETPIAICLQEYC